MADITWTIRIISMVAIFIPVLVTWRGIFQGYKPMGPTVVSEVTKQIAKIVFILVGNYLTFNIFGGAVLQANDIATFAAAIGAVAGILTLQYYWIKRRKSIKKMAGSDIVNLNVSYGKICKEIIVYSIPFVIVGLNFPPFNLVDQFTHNGVPNSVGVKPGLQGIFFNMLNMSTNKIVMIPTSLSVGFTVSLMPFIIKTYEEGRYAETYRQIRTSIGVLMFITVPASIGIMALAQPLFTVFYGFDLVVHGYDPNSGESRLSSYYVPVAILISLLSVTTPMLQGVDKQKLTVFITLGSVLIKLTLNYPLIILLYTPDAVSSTVIALLFATCCNLYILKKCANFKFGYSWIHLAKIILTSIIMMIGVEVIFFILGLFLEPTRSNYLIIVTIGVIVGATTYGGITIKARLVSKFLGDIFAKIRRKVKMLR